MPSDSPYPVCVACPSLDAYSQTFVADHIAHLPFAVRVLHGKPRPHRGPDGRRLVSPRSLRAASARWPAPARRWIGLARDAAYRRAIARFLRRERIRVVLAEFGPFGVALADPCAAAGVPLVVHFHGYDAYREDVLQEFGERYRRLFATSAAVVAVSSHMERQLASLGAPVAKLRRVVYGVDLARFRGADPAGAEPRLLAVGRFVEKKAPELTLLAFARIADRVPEARLVMVGDGPLLGACRAKADALGLGDRVDFPGVLAPEAVAAEMRRARAFVQHSVRALDGDCEGTPVAILEAQASGLPVVSTRHAGIAEAVVDGETGALVEERDVESMATAILRVLEDPMLAARWGAAGATRAAREWSRQESIARLATVLREAARDVVRPL